MIQTLDVRAADGALAGARYVRAGRPGWTTLVFVHGVGSTAAIWDAQLNAFGDDFDAVAIELRGTVRSKIPIRR